MVDDATDAAAIGFRSSSMTVPLIRVSGCAGQATVSLRPSDSCSGGVPRWKK